MSEYPETPIELVKQSLEKAIDQGVKAVMLKDVLELVEKNQWNKARQQVDEAARYTPESGGNLRAKFSWAHQWSMGRLPGVQQSDLDSHVYDPLDIRDAWLEVLSGGKHKAKRATIDETIPASTSLEPIVIVRPPIETTKKTENFDISEDDEYEDIRQAIDKGIL